MSVNPAFFLAIIGLICGGVFLNGLRFARMTRNPWAGKTLLGMPIEGHDLPVERVQLLGKIQMVAAPVFLFLMSYLVLSGKIGPLYGPEWMS
ncbi:MAG TPA: hypothetical protein VFR36_05540 [Sphingomicrobium sp.]|nr:hypothetical protein [Sphingomicrobium sp.]